MQEIYKDIVGYEGLYQVSNLGNVKSLPKVKKSKFNSTYTSKEIILKLGTDKYGYKCVILCKDYKNNYFRVHRLLAFAFIDNPYNKEHVNHINGIKSDNRLENLEWCTRSENIKHAIKLGLKPKNKGEKHGRVKLTNKQVLLIREDNRLEKEIAKDYNVCCSTIGMIKRRVIWTHI